MFEQRGVPDIKTIFKTFFSMLFVLQLIAVVSAGTTVEVWDHYNVTIKVDSSTVHVTEELTIKNVIDKPVVPGYGYLSLSKEESSRFLGLPFTSKGGTRGLKIREVSAKLDDGSQKKDVFVKEEGKITTIRYGFWIPIMPAESRTITIEYTTDDIVEKGLLFDHITYKVQPSSIPIENARIQANLEEDRHVSYSSYPPSYTSDAVSWEYSGLKDGEWKLDFEYSSLPLPSLPIKWSNISWGVILGIICLWSYRQWKVEK